MFSEVSLVIDDGGGGSLGRRAEEVGMGLGNSMAVAMRVMDRYRER